MQITFLGTGAGVPTKQRNVSCVALRLSQRAEVWLFDCGEATQHQILRSELKISQIARVFITHLHGDHIFGLGGLLATCGMAGNASRIDLYGPPGLEQYVRETLRYSETRLAYPLHVHVVDPTAPPVFADDEYEVTALPLEHRTVAFGYRVRERDRPGAFQVDKARAEGVPPGPLFGRLKRGETITLPEGRQLSGRDFTGEDERGRVVAYCTDTSYTANAVELARDADLLIHEATFAAEDEHLARQSKHSTAAQAARVAAEAGARRLMLTHISPRYIAGGKLTQQELLAEAREIFPNADLAYDFLGVDVPRREVKG